MSSGKKKNKKIKGTYGSGNQSSIAAFEKAKILGKQVKALGIFQGGVPLELHVSVTPKSMGRRYGRNNRREERP